MEPVASLGARVRAATANFLADVLATALFMRATGALVTYDAPRSMLEAFPLYVGCALMFTPAWRGRGAWWGVRTGGTGVLVALAIVGHFGGLQGAARGLLGRDLTERRNGAAPIVRPPVGLRLRSPRDVAEARSWVLGDWTAIATSFRDVPAPDPDQWNYLRLDPDGRGRWCTALRDDTRWSDCVRFRYAVERQDGKYPPFWIVLSIPEGRPRGGELGIDAPELTYNGTVRELDDVGRFRRGNQHPLAPTP